MPCFDTPICFHRHIGGISLTIFFSPIWLSTTFIIILLIQIFFVEKGIIRIAKVKERFLLDSLPAKQMVIEADLHSGRSTEREAENQMLLFQQKIDNILPACRRIILVSRIADILVLLLLAAFIFVYVC